MADPLAIAKEVFPIASQALDFAKNTRNFVIELQAAEAEKQKVNKLWGSIEFKLPAGNDLAAALAHLPQRSRPPIDDVLYLVHVTVGVRLGTSGRTRDDRTKTYLFGIVVRSVLRAYRAAALALAHAQAGATPVASGLKSDAPEHRALVQALQTMIQFQPRASMWDLLGANDIVQHLKDRIADVSPSILGRTIAWQRGGCCGPNWCCNSNDRRFVDADVDALFADVVARVVQPLVDTYSSKNLHGGQEDSALAAGQPVVEQLKQDKPKLLMVFGGRVREIAPITMATEPVAAPAGASSAVSPGVVASPSGGAGASSSVALAPVPRS
jgi:hypothetical protein